MAITPALFYTDTGSGENIILLHGMVGSQRYWDKIIPRLADNNRVIAFDLLGFGKSPKPMNIKYSLEDHVSALMYQINALNLENFTLVGHSMGSIISLGIAEAQPNRVTKLILTSMPIYKTPAIAKQRITHSKLVPNLMLYGPTAWITCKVVCYMRPIMKRLAPYIIKDVPRNIAIDSIDHNWASYSRSMLHVIQEQHVLEQLQNITMPTTILIGTKDPLVDEYEPKDLEKLSSNIKVVLVDATHHLPLETPDLVINAIETS